MADFSVGTEDWTEGSQGQTEELRRQLAEALKSSGICRTRWQELAARTKRERSEDEGVHGEGAAAPGGGAGSPGSAEELQAPGAQQMRASERERRTAR